MEKESNISSLKIGGIYTTNFNYFDIIVGIYKKKYICIGLRVIVIQMI